MNAQLSPDGVLQEAIDEADEVTEEIEEMERQLAGKRRELARLRGEPEMTEKERVKAIRRTLTKCRAALDSGRLSLEQFSSVCVAARGIPPTPGTFGKAIGGSPLMPMNRAATVANLQANGLGNLVDSHGNWR